MITPGHQVFLLSPANCSGKRAGYLLNGTSSAPLAGRLRSRSGAPMGDVFTFMSALYFRGKLAYASAFANPPHGWNGVQVIVPGRGLCPASTSIDLAALQRDREGGGRPRRERYTRPLKRDARAVGEHMGGATRSSCSEASQRRSTSSH